MKKDKMTAKEIVVALMTMFLIAGLTATMVAVPAIAVPVGIISAIVLMYSKGL